MTRVAFTSVVVGVDGSAESDDALSWALREAQLRQLPLRTVGAWYPAGTPEETENLAALHSVAELRSQLVDDLSSHVNAVVREAAVTDVPIDSRAGGA
ncbi:universal stress protein [Micromonospora sp. CPCC 206061]|uniref:universal stress protein n=1 Tax=Micromonospora sp. CPCC 206061 TaxID=3122410 RepID=UPI002FF16DB0